MVDLTAVESLEIPEKGPERVAVRVARRFGDSAVEQVISLRGGSNAVDIETKVDWHERQRLLKLAFPLDVHADRAASEIQFGHVYRRSIPTRRGTARASRSAPTAGCTWGRPDTASRWPTTRRTGTTSPGPAERGRVATIVRLSLLRAPLYPDPEADQGEHTMRCSLAVGASLADAVREGYRLNLPLREIAGADPVAPLLTMDHPAIVVEAVKLAEDRSGDVIVRLYEAHGGRARGTVRAEFPVGGVIETDLLERPLEDAGALRPGAEVAADGIALELRPFQIVTLRLTRP